ncbi:hypothetical protein BAUCODRAFT_22641 [Baudoinia panamericana UAMH 10762]|uniref:Uncharacterized protein n=1 Tax=Baudoinia panamericana (strain UAMH 10762) TaxID=717646 RepID=M2NJU8_BAUPA|nr:uncharacterized protein BAUCODRAFT_22641 [Baudoinia panamericana UAMH 10762]EMC99410.1 hypothetical protein BAUCODRAFT_22641 [Baudoinia panamericana UAMH 10762]
MSGSNNVTISMPGPAWGEGWKMLWPTSVNDVQLDIVGFLAILGEGSVTAYAQVAALSRLFLIPRLIPAPQALFYTRRPEALPALPANVTAVYSGMAKRHLHHVAGVLLDYEMKNFTVRCVRVKKRKAANQYEPSWRDRTLRGRPASTPALEMKDMDGHPELPVIEGPAAEAIGPLTAVTLLGFILSLVLFTMSIVCGDGCSLLATICLSVLSTLAGIVNYWTLHLPQVVKKGFKPPGDTVIRYPNGSYLVVKCEEEVARELFFAPEEMEYWIKSHAKYRLISLVGTLLLMFGVIALANARLELQVAWAGAYILINAAYWVVAALPPRKHWDLTSYIVDEEGIEGGPDSRNFTQALLKAIVLAGSGDWTTLGEPALPRTIAWDRWLLEVKDQLDKLKVNNEIAYTGQLQDPLPMRASRETMPGSDALIHPVPKARDHNGKLVPWDAKGAWDEISGQDKNSRGSNTHSSNVHGSNGQGRNSHYANGSIV